MAPLFPAGAPAPQPKSLWQDYYDECDYSPSRHSSALHPLVEEEREAGLEALPSCASAPESTGSRLSARGAPPESPGAPAIPRNSSLPSRPRKSATLTLTPSFRRQLRCNARQSGRTPAGGVRDPGSDEAQCSGSQHGAEDPGAATCPAANCQRWSQLLHHALSQEDAGSFSLSRTPSPGASTSGSSFPRGRALVARSAPVLKVTADDMEGYLDAAPRKHPGFRSQSLKSEATKGSSACHHPKRTHSKGKSPLAGSTGRIPSSKSSKHRTEKGIKGSRVVQDKPGHAGEQRGGIVRCMSCVLPGSACLNPRTGI